MKFDKILVANRGEIAVRIMRSAQELGLKVAAIYEETDKEAFHILRADEAICVGPGPGRITSASAKSSGGQADRRPGHPPGYGFLSGESRLPEACISEGLVFVGPPGSDPQHGQQGHRPAPGPGVRDTSDPATVVLSAGGRGDKPWLRGSTAVPL
jgi:acetyl/propionyl-CoA carboxylase alpha subunit